MQSAEYQRGWDAAMNAAVGKLKTAYEKERRSPLDTHASDIAAIAIDHCIRVVRGMLNEGRSK